VAEQISVKEKLILAAIECINDGGMDTVTIRSIAGKAEVNSAAVNYYFGNKKNLINSAMKRALANAMSNFDMLKDVSPNGKDNIKHFREFFLHYFQGMVNYPEITKSILYNPFISNKYDHTTMEWLDGFFSAFFENVKKKKTGSDDIKIKFMVFQMFSSMLVPSIFPGMFKKFTGLSLRENLNRDSYIDCLLEYYFGQENIRK